MMRNMGTIHLYRTLTLVMAFREEAISPAQKSFLLQDIPKASDICEENKVFFEK